MRANRYPLTTITGAQRASGQTHSRARSHQDGADLRADRSTAYLVSCIRVCSAHGNSLDRSQMQIDNNLVNLSPGMAVTVEIKTGSRTVISYLLSPILRYKHESLHER